MKYDATKRVQWVVLCGFSLSLGGVMWDGVDRMLVIMFPFGFAGILIRLGPKKGKAKR